MNRRARILAVSVASPHRRVLLPLPYAHVTAGSLVVHVSFGITRWHALGRAVRWAKADGCDSPQIHVWHGEDYT